MYTIKTDNFQHVMSGLNVFVFFSWEGGEGSLEDFFSPTLLS